MPNPHLLSGAYVRREAVLSSRIEGTQATASDLYLFELDPEEGGSSTDVREVRNYVLALDYAISRRGTLPISLRLIREVHERLLTGVRGQDKTPGDFRTSQNWIGGHMPESARFVPAPPEELMGLLDDLEKFLHREAPQLMPPLIECAIVHYQFEAIHPFLDGNGRVGRLLITLLALERGCLSHPLLYLSAYFERQRDQYYEELHSVSRTGNWEPWLLFFLHGVAEQAQDALLRAERVLDTWSRYRSLDLTPTASRVIEQLLENPYTTIKRVAQQADVSHPAASSAVEQLVQKGVLVPVDESRKRGRLFVAHELMAVFTSDIPLTSGP